MNLTQNLNSKIPSLEHIWALIFMARRYFAKLMFTCEHEVSRNLFGFEFYAILILKNECISNFCHVLRYLLWNMSELRFSWRGDILLSWCSYESMKSLETTLALNFMQFWLSWMYTYLIFCHVLRYFLWNMSGLRFSWCRDIVLSWCSHMNMKSLETVLALNFYAIFGEFQIWRCNFLINLKSISIWVWNLSAL